MEMIGVLATKILYHEMPATVNLLGTCCKSLATITIYQCQVSYLEMLGTYPIAGTYTWNCQVLKCRS